MKKYDGQRKVARKVEFQSVFRAPSRNFKILASPNVLAHGKSYEQGFVKKHDSHKLYAKSRFGRCSVSKFQHTGHSQRISPWEVV
ncbi:hypothetical protein BHE74_00055952 [Ensete ventricosum]|nr:hypothetical protein BHE74_00055952 [Ensete ventricosum]